MLWRTDIASPRVLRSSHLWRRISVALLIGLALTVAACGSTTGRTQPTPTSQPSATATPVPCTGWRIVASPTNTKYPNSSLSAVAALSPTAAWAVGTTVNYGDTSRQAASLIERWDGSAWHIEASTDAGGLSAVTAISLTDVWAVGSQSYPERPFIMHWNGTAWSIVPSPSPTGAWSAWLSDVVVITAQDVWAFGGQYSTPPDQQAPQLLVEHWNGASWQIVSSPPLPPTTSRFGGASLSATRIPGTNQLWAVGEWHEWIGLGRGEPLIERWNGSSWQIVPSPALPKDARGGGWSSVVALSPSDAWAVGSYGFPGSGHPLIAHWDGASWQNVVADPNFYGALTSVAASGAHDVRAAGMLLTGSGASSGTGQAVPLIEQWNGITWQTATTPALPSGAHFYDWQGLHIATDGAGNYWVVGSYGGQYQTLHCP
jgi:hypothetical protein